ncbi:PAS domain S-box protein [Chloroflexi bacterium CFX3]|nr:PAS domain S-box protein [Chloroflexi bacterium CFX3]
MPKPTMSHKPSAPESLPKRPLNLINGGIFMVACLLISIVWWVAQHHTQSYAESALRAFQARSLAAVRAAAATVRNLVWNESGNYTPEDSPAFILARTTQALASTQNLLNVMAWTYCTNCAESTLPLPFAHRGSDINFDMLTNLTTATEAVGMHTLPEGTQMLAAWTPLNLSASTWLIGISIPLTDVQAQTQIIFYQQDVTLLASLLSFLIAALAFGAVRLRYRERGIVRRLRDSQARAAEHQTFAEALSDIGMALTSALDLEEVMARILSNVGRVVPHSSVSIMVTDGGTYRLAYGRFPDDKVAHVEHYMLSPELQRIFDEMSRTHQARHIADTETDPRWIQTDRQSWVKSYVGTPILVQDQVIGILNLNSDQRNHFTAQHAELLQVFAVQAGVALQNARLYAESRRYAAELEQRVSARTATLQQRSALFQAIVENMTDGLAYFDLQSWRTLYVNSSFLQLTGYEAEEIVDQSLDFYRRFFQSPEFFDQARLRLRDAIARKGVWQTEFEAVRKDGTTFACALTATVVRDAQNEPIGQLNLLRDVSQEKSLQEQRERFIANASHELRTPITNLKLRLYLAQRDGANRDQHFEVMDRMIKHLTRLVENLLDLPRFERGALTIHRENVNLCDLLKSAVDIHLPRAVECGVRLTLELPKECFTAQLDPTRITQVVDNLLANALNYTAKGGSIRVRLHANTQSLFPSAIISVVDSGIGIAPEALVRIFEPFFREQAAQKVRGTGLGLTIAKQIVELHGGMIRVESQQGVGSTFSVTLPISSVPQPAP